MDRNKLIKSIQRHIDEEEALEQKISKEPNPNNAYKLTKRLYAVRILINSLLKIIKKLPHNKSEHEFDAMNPNYDKIDYDKIDRKKF